MGTESFVLLFVVAAAVAVADRRLRLPYTVALVCAGLLGSIDARLAALDAAPVSDRQSAIAPITP